MDTMNSWDLAADVAPAALAPPAPRSRVGLAALTLSALLLIGALALVYLGQVGAVADASARWQAEQAAQTRLLRADQEAQARLATAQTVAYIVARARALGMAPVPPSAITIVVAPAATPAATPTASATPGGQP
jgi:hypothetical protein